MNTIVGIDWSKYKFHCSGLGNLMVKSRKDGELSETTKSYLRELWIKETWGREKIDMIGNKYTTKGVMCETDSIELFERVTGIKCFKNNKQLENDWIVGTPDVVSPKLIDIKTSWDLYTFMAVDENKALKDYAYQLLGYMWLTRKRKAILAYCLVNTPDIIINDELYRLSFKLPEDHVEQYKNNFVFDDIPSIFRVKQYLVEHTGEIKKLKKVIKQARYYLSNIRL